MTLSHRTDQLRSGTLGAPAKVRFSLGASVLGCCLAVASPDPNPV